jgi:hypothetical protein
MEPTTSETNTEANKTTLNSIPINKEREDATFNVKDVLTNSNNPHKLLENLNKIINVNNTSSIDFTKGGVKNNPLVSVNTMFSDNIVLYCFLPEDAEDKFKDLAKMKESKKSLEDYKEQDEEEEDNVNSKLLLKISKAYLAEFTDKICRCFKLLDITVNKAYIKPIQPKRIDGKIAQILKVSLVEVPYKDIAALIGDRAKIESLQKDNIYINDIDFTQDFKGVFNKSAFIKYLLQQNFRMEKDPLEKGRCKLNNPKDAEPEDLLETYEGTILNNNALVGRNCLTFITKIEGLNSSI